VKGLLTYVGLLLAFFAGSAAAQNTYTAYINSDNSAASGCTITLPGGTFAGADLRVQATLTPGATPTVTGVTLTACSGGTFGAGTSIGGGSVDLNTGVSGSDSVEFSVPGAGIVTGGTQALAFGFTAESPTGSDVMFTTNGGPIIFGITVPTPALGAGALALLVLLIMGVAGRFGRTRWYRHMAALSLVAMCGVALAAAFNWTGIAPIATDPAGDPTNGSPDIDLRAGFVALSSGSLYIRIDVADLQTQAPQITSANATTFVVGQAGTFTATSIGVPSAALALSGCTLPAGVTFVDNGNGTATLAGAPGPGTANTYACTLTASNGIPPDATQAFTLTVANAPSQTALAVDINPSVFAQTVTFTATVTPAPPGSGTPTGTVNFLDGATNIGSGTLNGSGVATFATGTLSVATHPITAQYAGDVNFGPSTSSIVNQVVNQASQTITFTSTAPAGATVGGATYTVTATASSGLAVTLTIDASATSVCSIAGSTVSFIGVGNCVIDANQAGDANYTAAPQAQQSFAVGKGSQTITFTSTAPAAAAVGGPTYTVTATSSAGLTPVTFTIDASATSVCSLAGSTVSFIAAGTCLIDANQAGNANYNAAPLAQQSFAVGKGSQTIAFTSTAPANAVVAGPTYTVTATASSGLPVAFTIDATASSVCSIAGATVSFIASGTCVIDANQAGDANWNAAPQAAQSFAVSKNNQTIAFSSTAPVGAVVAGPTYTVTATASSGLTVAFSIDASATSVCSIAGSTVTYIGAGTCVIDANQAGDANYNAAPQVAQSFPVGKGTQTISFTSSAPVGATVGGPTYTVTATATSGLPVTLSIDASAASVCSIAGPTVSFIGAGTCVIDANQAGNANYNAAPQAQQSFAVAKGNQTISFTSTAPAAAQFNGSPYTVTATATSGLAVTFTIDASATSVCSIAGSTVSFIGAGTCVIDANQAGDANWNAAPQVQQSFAVAKANQTISFTSTPPAPAFVNGGYTVSATASSGLAVTFSAGAPAVCTVSGSTVTFVGAGTCIVDADQAGNADYNAAPQAQQTFTVSRNDQTITFTSTAPATAKNGGATYTVSATASSGLTVTFSSATPGVCTVATATVTFVGAGTCTINADQAGNAAYNPAPQVQQSFLVAKGDQTIAFTSTLAAFVATGSTYNAVATATSGLAVVFTIDASSTSGCSVVGNVVTFNSPIGTCVIDADQPGDANWNPAPQVQQSTSVLDPPNAVDDSDTATGNVSIAVAASGVLGNDTGTSISITAFDAASANGGTVVVNGDGSYSYDPPANFTGSDTFTYTIDNALNQPSTGTVTVTVKDRVMVVASGATGNCKPTTPCAMSFADGLAAPAPTSKDLVFVQSGNYTAPNATIALNANQVLVGNAVSLTTAIGDAGITLAPDSVAPTINASTTPTLTNAGNVIVLAGGNLVEYFAITNTAGAAIAGTSAGSGTSNIHGIAVNNTIGNGVSLTANLGTVNFSNLTVTTTSGVAFAATGGGTVNATQDNTSTINTLSSTTGTALNVVNTTIGASGLTFRSITAGTAASGPANGIVLNNTGASGGLTVTGNSAGVCGGNVGGGPLPGTPLTTTAANSADCTGGTIQKATNAAISLTSTANVSLTRVHLTNNTHYGILGSGVSGFTLTDSLIDGTNGSVTGSAFDGSINFQNLTGSASITRAVITGGFYNNITVKNDSATPLNRITLDKTQTGSTNVNNNDNINFESLSGSSAVIKATIQNSVLTAAAGDLLQYANNGNASGGDIVLTNSQLSNNHPLIATGGGGVSISGGAGGDDTFKIDHSTFRDSVGSAVSIVKPSSTAHTYVGTFDSNRIGVTGVANSGSLEGSGLKIQTIGGGVGGTGGLTATVTNNVIQQYNNDGMTLQAGGGAPGDGTGFFNATATNNAVGPLGTNTSAAQGVGVRVTSGTASGDSFQSCAKIALNTLTNSGITGTPSDYRVRQRFGTTVRLPGYSNTPGNTAAVVSFLDSNNTTTAVPGGTATADYPATGGGFTGTGTTCP
jgi:hypothetical protein